VARVRMRGDTFEDLVRLGYVEIIRYGADSPQVVRRIHAALTTLAERGDARHRACLDEMRALLVAATGAAMPPAFTDLSSRPDPRGLG
jgi:hypothetical protein